MSRQFTRDFLIEVAQGNVPNHAIVNKFGASLVGTTLQPITNSGTYQTPTTAQALELVSDDANDNVAGTGAREVTVEGLDGNWNEVTQTVVPNGTTAVALGTNLTRLYRWYVSQSGTYATDVAASHAGNLTIQASGGGTVWSSIPITPTALGQSLIGVYSVPTGKTAYLLSKNIFTDSGKTADVFFFYRGSADDVTAPYTGTFRLIQREIGVAGGIVLTSIPPKGPFVGPCDIGFMGVTAVATDDISVEFSLLVVG